MKLSDEQLHIAAQINARVRHLEQDGCDEMTIFVSMAPFMPSFKRLLDTAGQQGMDELCAQFDSFYHYAKILEHIAGAIRSGDIKV
jgi:hypothetical protein